VPSIFVQIPAYHDIELVNTIDSIYLNASGENTINVGVHFNYFDNLPYQVEKCLSNKFNIGAIRSIVNKAPDGLGASLSRYIANSLYDSEDYYLQLDSHMILRKNWDALLIEDFKYLEQYYDSKIAISAYPNMYTRNKDGRVINNLGSWIDSPADSNDVDMNDINWISHAIEFQIKPKIDRCIERNPTDSRHNNISGAFLFSTGDMSQIYTPLPNVIIEETILSMKIVSSGFNVVGRLREIARHLGPHPYMLTLNGFDNIRDEEYEKLLLEYPRRLARVDFAELHPVSRDINIVKDQLTGNPKDGYILFNNMTLNEYLELSELEIVR
jgi:hypothetical protein